MNIKCSKDKMLTCLLVCGVLFQLTNGPTLGQVSSNRTVDWAAITRAYGAFLELPSDENAKLFSDTVPATAPENNDLAQEGRFLEFFTFYRNYPIFKLAIWGGSADATRAAFRLLNLISSAGHGEVITYTLSHLIRINPYLFLEVLFEYKDSSSFKIFHDQLVGSTDPAYVDRIAAKKNELQLRISALEKVKDQRYLLIRNKCIEYLKARIDEIPNSIDLNENLPNHPIALGSYFSASTPCS